MKNTSGTSDFAYLRPATLSGNMRELIMIGEKRGITIGEQRGELKTKVNAVDAMVTNGIELERALNILGLDREAYEEYTRMTYKTG